MGWEILAALAVKNGFEFALRFWEMSQTTDKPTQAQIDELRVIGAKTNLDYALDAAIKLNLPPVAPVQRL